MELQAAEKDRQAAQPALALLVALLVEAVAVEADPVASVELLADHRADLRVALAEPQAANEVDLRVDLAVSVLQAAEVQVAQRVLQAP